MIRSRLFGLLVFFAVGTANAADGQPAYREITMGNANAAVTVIEYISLTCPHCARFALEDLPLIKKAYIDTGKIRFIYRDFPWDPAAMMAAMLVHCAPGEGGQILLEAILKNQDTWMKADQSMEPLLSYTRSAGMSESDVRACLKNDNLLNAIKQQQQTAAHLYKIDLTPTFLIGAEKVEGADYDDVVDTIDKALAKTKKK